MASQNNNTASSYWCIRYGDKDCPKLCFADPEALSLTEFQKVTLMGKAHVLQKVLSV